MDEPQDTSAPAPERTAPLLGGLVVIVALSSLLDDAGVVEHPWWVPLAIGTVVVTAALMANTIRRLVHHTPSDGAPRSS